MEKDTWYKRINWKKRLNILIDYLNSLDTDDYPCYPECLFCDNEVCIFADIADIDYCHAECLEMLKIPCVEAELVLDTIIRDMLLKEHILREIKIAGLMLEWG